MRMLLLICTVLISVIISGHHVQAQEKGINGIVVVDIQQLEGASDAGKSLQKKLVAKRDAFQKEVADKEKTLRAEQEALLKQKDSLPVEEFKEKAIAFEKKLIESQKTLQEKRAALDKSVGEAIGKLRSEVVKIISEMADKNGYKLVMSRQDIVIVEKSVDITAEVMKALNERVKDIPLK